MRAICVFCGSSPGADPDYLAQARELGAFLAAEGLTLVYGGASVGLMGAAADAALAAGGRVIGVLPDFLKRKELAHAGLSELVTVTSMHERKARMAELSDGFMALPGGLGTLEELCEAATWAQLGLHAKPCGLLNVGGYYDAFLDFLATMARERFMREQHQGLILAAETPQALLEKMRAFTPVTAPKWLDGKRI